MSSRVATPFCKICKDAGKSEKEYTSHYTHSKPGPDGVIVCPYLLSIECRYCHEFGHTPKYCKNALTLNKQTYSVKEQTTPTRPKPTIVPSAPKRPHKISNMFDVLELDEETETPVEKQKPLSKKDIEYPQLSQKSKQKSKQKPKSKPTNLWAQFASKQPLSDVPKLATTTKNIIDETKKKAIAEHNKWEKEHMEMSLNYALNPGHEFERDPSPPPAYYDDVLSDDDEYCEEVYIKSWGSFDVDEDDNGCFYEEEY